MLSTVPITIAADSFTQLIFTTGCSAAPSGEFEVALEYLDSHASGSWSILSTQWCDPTVVSCTSLAMASQFQSSDFAAGWHRVTFRLPRASNRRYRLVATSSSRTVQRAWGVSDWVIATGCPVVNGAPCGGFGFCNQSSCQCDIGFRLDSNGSCVAENTLKTFVEEFAGGLQQAVWQALPIGGQIVTPPCGQLGESTVYKFDGKYGRRLFSKALNTTGSSYLSSTILVGGDSSACDAIETSAEGVVIIASINNGVTWQVLERYTSTSRFNDPVTQTLVADSRWQSDQTIIGFWQPQFTAIPGLDVWFLDSVHLGYARSTLPPEARFAGAVFPDDHFSQVTNEVITTFCGRSGVAAFAGDNEATVSIETVPLDLGNGSYIQIELSTGCTTVAPANRFEIVFEESDDLGASWRTVFSTPCNPSTDSTCRSSLWYMARDLDSLDYAGWTRVTLPLPSVRAGRRYRVSALDKSDKRSLYVSYLYFGNGCNSGFDVGCGQHGRCTVNNTCTCDTGYSVQDGLCRLTVQATTLKDAFSTSNAASWLRQLGGVAEASDCGTVAAGFAMNFEALGTRLLLTTDLDLTNGLDVFYILQMGEFGSSSSCSNPSSSAEGTVLLYSLDSGIRWTVLVTHSFSSYRRPTRVREAIPAVARQRGVKLMLMQPTHSTFVGADEWAVDDFGVASGVVWQLPMELSYDFTATGATIENVTFAPNAAVATCSNQQALLISGSATFKSIETDLMLVNNSQSFMQLDISAGCGSSFPSTFEIEPRFTLAGSEFEYNVATACDSSCLTWSGQATADYLGASLTGRFRRIAIPISPNTQARRFRLQLRETLNSHRLGIKAMYIGDACDFNCRGFGMCTPTGCKCDRGFARTADGRGCIYDTLLSELRDDFDDEIFVDRWPVAMGGSQQFEGGSCGHQSSGFAYVFAEPGMRWLESTDLNLNKAEFVQYQMYSSGGSSSSGCRTPSSSEGMSLGYSVDFGRSWSLLDYSSVYSDKTVIATLPAAAKTNHTRLVLWQREHADLSGFDVIAVDDFYVGPDADGVLSALQDNFDNIDETQFLNIDGGTVQAYCSSTGKALVLRDDSIDELLVTTQDVNMQPGELVLLNQPLSATADASFIAVSGAADDVARPCGLASGLIFDLKTPRRLETKDFVVSSTGLNLTFQLAMNAGGCDAPEIENGENITLDYSLDMGATWTSLETYSASSSPTFNLDTLGSGSGSGKKLRFRWQQAKFDNRSIGFDAWAIDNIQIRGFPQYQYYLQFKLRTSCVRASSNEVEVRMSTTRTSFSRYSSCSPMSASSCAEFGELPTGEIDSAQAPSWRRFTLPLGINPGARVRVQWQQPRGGDFALDDVYFGRGCPDMCNNQGACQLSGLCVCDAGYNGASCAESTVALPSYFAATHSEATSPWALTTGSTTSIRGCLSGTALYFPNSIVNEAITPLMDTSQATHLSYDWKNCATSSSYSSFIVACSTNGGLSWLRLADHLNQFRGASGSNNITLPPACRAPVALFKFYAGDTRSNYWAIDEVYVSGVCSASSCLGDQVCVPTNTSTFTCACPGAQVALANGTCVSGT